MPNKAVQVEHLCFLVLSIEKKNYLQKSSQFNIEKDQLCILQSIKGSSVSSVHQWCCIWKLLLLRMFPRFSTSQSPHSLHVPPKILSKEFSTLLHDQYVSSLFYWPEIQHEFLHSISHLQAPLLESNHPPVCSLGLRS